MLNKIDLVLDYVRQSADLPINATVQAFEFNMDSLDQVTYTIGDGITYVKLHAVDRGNYPSYGIAEILGIDGGIASISYKDQQLTVEYVG